MQTMRLRMYKLLILKSKKNLETIHYRSIEEKETKKKEKK